jgi:hypothetical protein
MRLLMAATARRLVHLPSAALLLWIDSMADGFRQWCAWFVGIGSKTARRPGEALPAVGGSIVG